MKKKADKTEQKMKEVVEQAMELDKISSMPADELAHKLNIQNETAELIKCLINKFLTKW